MRVHHVERHLHGIEVEAMLRGFLRHAEMNVRIFVSGESFVAGLAGLLRLKHCFLDAAFGKDAVWAPSTGFPVKVA